MSELKPVNFKAQKLDRNKLNKDPSVSESSAEESRRSHLSSDVDTSPRALHHTLGIKHNQSSPGDHVHDGITSKKIGPMEMDPDNPGETRPQLTIPEDATTEDIVEFLHNFIEFREV